MRKGNQMGSVGSSSAGSSSADSNRERINNEKHFTENTRLAEIIRQYSSLEDNENIDYFTIGGTAPGAKFGFEQNQNEDDRNQEIGANIGATINFSNAENKNIFVVVQSTIFRKLFQINNVLLDHQAITPIIFHVIMILEFLQMLFYIFLNVYIINEFTSVSLLTLPSSAFANSSTNQDGLLPSDVLNTTLIDYNFLFINPQLYALDAQDNAQYYTFYVVVNAVFYLFVFLLFSLSDGLFIAHRNEDLKEGMKMILRVFSIILVAFIFILQVPMYVIYLQSYMCNEDLQNTYALSVQCGSTENQVMIAISTISLIIYVCFVVTQSLLYTSNNFANNVPWASFDRNISLIKILLKLIVSASFAFNKEGIYSGPLLLICFFINFVYLYKLSTSAKLINNYIYYASLIYESLQTWLFLTISVHLLSATDITIISLITIFIVGILFGVLNIRYQLRGRQIIINTENPISSLKTSESYLFYLYLVYQYIDRLDKTDRLSLEGLMSVHLDSCCKSTCNCTLISQKIDGLRKYSKIKQSLENLKKDSYGASEQDMEIGRRLSEGKIGKQGTIKRSSSPSGRIGEVDERKPRLKSIASFGKIMSFGQEDIQEEIKEGENINKSGSRVVQDMNEQVREELALHFEVEEIEQSYRISKDQHEKLKKHYFKFLSLLIEEGIEKYPKNVELRIISSMIQRSKLNNEFKAIFELMNSEACQPSLSHRFRIFRRKVLIEQSLLHQHDRNVLDIGNINIVSVYTYEKFFLRYAMLEYITANSALKFWRELLQKNIDASALQMRGAEISKNYERIQDVSKELFKIYPNEIKFLYRYAMFLSQIVNNEYDAVNYFEQAYHIFQSKISKKAASMPINEQTTYGENSAAGIIVVSATSSEIGRIVQSNDEIEFILGHKREDIIGRNVSIIMPLPIGEAHNQFISTYFETAKSTVIDKQIQHFAATANGYLKPVKNLIKVYPQLTDKILFIGFIQEIPKYERMPYPPKSEFEMMESQYIMCDHQGFISNITEGLCLEIGLNSKFFQYSHSSIYDDKISINMLMPELLDSDYQEIIEGEGHVFTIDTREILDLVELERLTSEEVLEIRSRIGVYDAYVQLKNVDIQNCKYKLYRLIMVNEDDNLNIRELVSDRIQITSNIITEDENNMKANSQAIDSDHANSEDIDLMSISSSGGFSSINAFDKIIRDFKKVLSERKTPGNLVFLNRIIILIIFATIVLSSVDFGYKQSFINYYTSISQNYILSEIRNVQLIQLATNIRSLINAANGLEFIYYEGDNLHKIDRISYLSNLVQAQAFNLSLTHDALIQSRTDVYSNTNQLLYAYEYENINLYRLDMKNNVNVYSLPYRIALNSYLNQILELNGTLKPDLLMDPQLVLGDPKFIPSNTSATNLFQKNIYYIIANGLRAIRDRSMLSNLKREQNSYTFTMNSIFMIIMILGLIVSTISIISVLYSIWITEKNKADTLSLYAMLKMEQIKKVYDKCNAFIDSLSHSEAMPNTTVKEEDSYQFYAGNAQGIRVSRERDGEQSEEEKEEKQFEVLIKQKKINRAKELSRMERKKGAITILGQERYNTMIKKSLSQIKNIQDQGQLLLKKSTLSKKTFAETNNSQRELLQEEMISRTRKHKAKSSISVQNLDSSDSEKSDEERSEPGNNSLQRKPSISYKNERQESKKKLEELIKAELALIKDFDMKLEELENRKKIFYSTVKNKNWRFLLTNGFIGLLFAFYFVYCFLYHYFEIFELQIMKDNTPVFFNRYSDIILGYSFLRERILFNNSVDSFVNPSSIFSPPGIDEFFIQQSLESEQQISQLLLLQYQVLQPMIDFENIADSPAFCTSVIGEFSGQVEQKVTVSKNMEKKLRQIRNSAYQNLITTTIAACNAASAGDLPTLIALAEQGVDLNIGDYDNRTPLHVGTGAGHMDIVKYLISQGVQIDPVDRWGATPLCDAQAHPEIKAFLISQGAKLGKIQQIYTPFQVQVTDDQFRLYYAAFFGDVAMMDNLRLLGWNVNGQDYDGRTALGIAASQGNLAAVKYLVAKGGDLSIKDSRGNDPLGDAIRENRTATIEYLRSIINQQIIRDYCSQYYQGLQTKGLKQTLGVFHKKFMDLQIFVQGSSRNESLQQLMTTNLTVLNQSYVLLTNQTNSSTLQSLPMFISTSELYLEKVIDQFILVAQKTISLFSQRYLSTSQIAFFIFILFQVVILIFLRKKLIEIMRDDVFQSRGILNLIPEDFFLENRDSVEKLIKKLKD